MSLNFVLLHFAPQESLTQGKKNMTELKVKPSLFASLELKNECTFIDAQINGQHERDLEPTRLKEARETHATQQFFCGVVTKRSCGDGAL